MLIREKMKQIHFSTAEENVIKFLLHSDSQLEDLTVKQIAEITYVHPSTLIRVAKKLNFSGWSALKNAFLAESHYLNTYFTETDANLPFSPQDGIMTVAHKIASLEKDTIADSLSLLHHDQLQKAQQLLLNARTIKIFGSNANLLIAEDFALKMRRLNRAVRVVSTMNEQAYEAHNTHPDDVCILISYTGENIMMTKLAELFNQKKIPFVALTSIGENTLAEKAQAVLHITTRERLYSKIANYSINSSISFLLDVLYSCVFAEDYEKNLNHLITIGEQVDIRKSSSEIMAESNVQYQDFLRPN